ncbi:GDP-perosamine synthase [Paenibacillus allorhizoplanae]|uniref:GDP-perosamine synthase n=1 Tax=Paenibacillus allorhizoplanae TaxID=2905648 RepID=A0ABN8GYQ6_9BACL|nr:LegC family aminotransferase [Paenibacillus allorhizoplanae]CAH1215806.1 GDP-perosamine synthase [Paenibacillus allorhizoplanae]
MTKTAELTSLIVDKLKDSLPKENFIALHEPHFSGNEWKYVKECLDTGWVSSVGKYVDLFEQMLSDYTGVQHAIAVGNGTAALHASLLIAGVGPGEEVLIPSLSFIATANAVSYCGAIPHFVDVEELTLGMDPRKLADYLKEITEERYNGCYNRSTGRRISAVVVMHTFGHPVDLEPIVEVCDRYGLTLIEDAAESLGSYYKGKHTGNWGKLSAVSFNGNKTITTGGGGAILTNDPNLAKQVKHITTTAKVPHQWEFYHDQIGYNYRLPNINAALGCAQLEQLPDFIHKKRSLASMYHEAFREIPGVTSFKEADFACSNYWLNALVFDQEYRACREIFLNQTNSQGIMTRPVWVPLHKLEIYSACPAMDLSYTNDLSTRLVNIPSSVILGHYE